MTISANNLISGATALSFEDLAELQAAIAEMEKDNLQLFIGTKGQSGFFDVEQMSNKSALDFTNQAASQQLTQGWMQFGENMGSALSQAGGLASGYLGSKGLSNEADELESTIPKTDGGLKVTVTKPNEIEMEDFASATGVNKPAALAPASGPVSDEQGIVEGQLSSEQTPTVTKKIEAETEEVKAIRTRAENIRTRAANIQSRYQNFGQLAGNVITGGFKAKEGYIQKDITQSQGISAYLQGTGEITKQVSSMTTSAISAELGQEQAAAQAFQGIVSLTGAARG